MSMYSPKEPSTEYPPLIWSWHSVSQPRRQYSQLPQALQSQAFPAISPTSKITASSPSSTTSPTPSWQGINGGEGFTGQSPSKACKSVLHTPVEISFTNAWYLSGFGLSVFSMSMVLPNFLTIPAFIAMRPPLL